MGTGGAVAPVLAEVPLAPPLCVPAVAAAVTAVAGSGDWKNIAATAHSRMSRHSGRKPGPVLVLKCTAPM